MTVYSTKFAAGVGTGSTEDVYTVPAGYVAVVRDIEVISGSGASDVLVFECVSPGPLHVVIWVLYSTGANVWGQWRGRVVLVSGDAISALAPADGSTYLISGYLLSA